jgi:hypothetical protein
MNPGAATRLTLVDSHVHYCDCFDADSFFTCAFDNLRAEAARMGSPGAASALLLAETEGKDWFGEMSSLAGSDAPFAAGSFRLERTDEADSLRVNSPGEEVLFLVAGRQIVTAESLEVLALGTTETFADGGPVEAVLDAVREAGALPVLPWGAGKWWGKRGRIVKNILRSRKGRHLWLADSGTRPVFWPRPSLFREAGLLGVGILGGTDPLPIPGEEKRVGSFGFSFPLVLSAGRPWHDLRACLVGREDCAAAYGRRESAAAFFGSQLRLRFGAGRAKGRGR